MEAIVYHTIHPFVHTALLVNVHYNKSLIGLVRGLWSLTRAPLGYLHALAPCRSCSFVSAGPTPSQVSIVRRRGGYTDGLTQNPGSSSSFNQPTSTPESHATSHQGSSSALPSQGAGPSTRASFYEAVRSGTSLLSPTFMSRFLTECWGFELQTS